MKVEFKTKDDYFDIALLECSAVEYLILIKALRDFSDSRCNDWEDRAKAIKMLEVLRKREENK